MLTKLEWSYPEYYFGVLVGALFVSNRTNCKENRVKEEENIKSAKSHILSDFKSPCVTLLHFF